MSKIDVRRLQMLARQRQKLEEEAAQLQAEVDAMVLPSFPPHYVSGFTNKLAPGTRPCRKEEMTT